MRRVYRPRRAIRLVNIGFVAVSLLVVWRLAHDEGLSLLSVGGVTLVLLGLVGVADAWTARLVLTDEAIEWRANFRRHRFARSACREVSLVKGLFIRLILADGGRVELPTGLGLGRRELVELQAWLAGARADAGNVDRAENE